MLFTDGNSQFYERMMKERPGWDKYFEERAEQTIVHRDCTHCLHYINKTDICEFDICPYIED